MMAKTAVSIHKIVLVYHRHAKGLPSGWPRPRTERVKGEVGRARGPDSSTRRMNWMGVKGEECVEEVAAFGLTPVGVWKLMPGETDARDGALLGSGVPGLLRF